MDHLNTLGKSSGGVLSGGLNATPSDARNLDVNYARAIAEKQALAAQQYASQTYAGSPVETAAVTLVAETQQIAEVCAQFAMRLGNIGDRLIGGIPRVADNNKAEQSPRRCSGVLGEIEGAHQLAAVHLHRIKATIERLEQNI